MLYIVDEGQTQVQSVLLPGTTSTAILGRLFKHTVPSVL